MNDTTTHDPSDIYNPMWKVFFTFGETKDVELGVRPDGVVVWREAQ